MNSTASMGSVRCRNKDARKIDLPLKAAPSTNRPVLFPLPGDSRVLDGVPKDLGGRAKRGAAGRESEEQKGGEEQASHVRNQAMTLLVFPSLTEATFSLSPLSINSPDEDVSLES